MSLRNFVAQLATDNRSRPAAVITFDDGYADNLQSAKPLLERFDIPATVFLTTGYLGGQREFWWDELDRLLLQPGVLPLKLQLTIEGTVHDWDLGDAADYSAERWEQNRGWIVSQLSPSARHAAFFAIWRLLQFLPADEQRRALDDLRSWAGASEAARPSHRQLADNEIVELVRDGLIEAGAHSVTHPVLANLPARLQREEIQRSVARVEEIVGRRAPSFAYPFGSRPDFTDETAAIVRDTGCVCACSTILSAVPHNADRFRLPRFQVDNWNGDQLSHRLRQWLS